MVDKAKAKNARGDAVQVIVKNRRATFDFAIEDKLEAGIVLVGSEVKSLRQGKCDLVDAYAQLERGEAWLRQMHIPPFEQAKAFPHEPRRARKLLLHASELERLAKATQREGYTLVPLEVYFKAGRVKVLIGVARGKKNIDKRADIAKKTADREARAEMNRARKHG